MADRETLPGETPIEDISGLKNKTIRTRKELNVLEAENIRKVIVKYLSKKPTRRSARFDLSWAKRLHREMLGDVWKWAGTFRTCDLNIGVPWQHVESRLHTLLCNLAYWEKSGMEQLEQAVLLHHQAGFIHPFLNGNGRWARMLGNIWLKLHEQPPTAWPEQPIGNVSTLRSEYLAAINLADKGDYGALKELHKRFTPHI